MERQPKDDASRLQPGYCQTIPVKGAEVDKSLPSQPEPATGEPDGPAPPVRTELLRTELCGILIGYSPSLAAKTIISITYDIDIKSLQDPYILTAEAAGESISETATPGSFLVDVLPIRKSGSLCYTRVVLQLSWSLLQSSMCQSGFPVRVSRLGQGCGPRSLTDC